MGPAGDVGAPLEQPTPFFFFLSSHVSCSAGGGGAGGAGGGRRGEEQEEELNLLDCFVGNGFTYEFGCL